MTSEWLLVYEGFDPDTEGLREALCTLGNGYFATRGAAAESSADGVHYPGTYIAGCYDRLVTEVAGREVENEDLVNVPNWLPLSFRIGDGDWFDPGALELLDYRQELDVRRGLLTRAVRARDGAGRVTSVTQRRFVHMGRPHLAAMETTIVAENWSGPVELRSALDGTVTNSGVARYRSLRGDHLVPVDQGETDKDRIHLEMQTRQSKVYIAMAARTRVTVDGDRAVDGGSVVTEPGFVAQDIQLDLDEGVPVTIEKVVAVHTSRDFAISEAGLAASSAVAEADSFAELLERHALAWDLLWQRFDLPLVGDGRAGLILRLHIFHLLQTVSPNSIDLDAGVPARGLHGEAYRGHIFWDELFIFPLLNLRLPDPHPVDAQLPVPAARRRPQPGPERGPRRSHVPVAERQRRPRGDPDGPSQPHVRDGGCPTTHGCSATSTWPWPTTPGATTRRPATSSSCGSAAGR